jgi:hypothetical protein
MPNATDSYPGLDRVSDGHRQENSIGAHTEMPSQEDVVLIRLAGVRALRALLGWWFVGSPAERRRRVSLVAQAAHRTSVTFRLSAGWLSAQVTPDGYGNMFGRVLGMPAVSLSIRKPAAG